MIIGKLIRSYIVFREVFCPVAVAGCIRHSSNHLNQEGEPLVVGKVYPIDPESKVFLRAGATEVGLSWE